MLIRRMTCSEDSKKFDQVPIKNTYRFSEKHGTFFSARRITNQRNLQTSKTTSASELKTFIETKSGAILWTRNGITSLTAQQFAWVCWLQFSAHGWPLAIAC